MICHEGSDYPVFIDNDAHAEYEEILLNAYDRTSPLSSTYRPTENPTVEEDLEAIAEFSDDGGYVERHHILPVALGGTKKRGFVTIDLTFAEHFRCHQLLIDFSVGEDRRKMLHALGMMLNGRILTPEQYSIARQAIREAGHSDASRAKMRKPKTSEHRAAMVNGRRAGRGWKLGPLSAEHRAKIGIAGRGLKRTPEQCERISVGVSKAQKGKKRGPHSAAHRAALSASLRGMPFSSERCANISAAVKVKSECPYCHQQANRSQLTRYHGDRCKANQLHAGGFR